MNDGRFAFRQLPMNPSFTTMAVLTVALLFVGPAFAELAVHRVEIVPRALESHVLSKS